MTNYTSNTRIIVYQFIRQVEDEEVIIGHSNRSMFLALSSDAVELLDNLAMGMTVGEVKSLYFQRYNETPDLENFLESLENKGFIKSLTPDKALPSNSTRKITTSSLRDQKPVRYHFANFPKPLAQNLFDHRVLVSCSVCIGLALIALTLDVSIIPGWNAYFFTRNLTLMRLILILFHYVTIFLHEMAHLVAARAVGVSCHMRLGNRMWYLVAETDMTGIWGVPRNLRYLPFLAGSLLDATSASLLILILFAQNREWLILNSTILQLARAILLTYLMRLLWQCYLFIRTDFYFAIANYFRCKSLLNDTEIFLQNQVSKYFHKVCRHDQSHIPASEMRVVRWYAVLWIVGRLAAISTLVLITIPLFWHYCIEIFSMLGAGYKANLYAFIDALLMGILILFPQMIGFVLWIRSFKIWTRETS